LASKVQDSSQELFLLGDHLKTKLKIKDLAVRKAIATLAACGAQYKIILSDGTIVGELNEGPRKKSYGDLTKHIKPLIDEMKIGDVAIIPIIAGFTLAQLHSGVTSRANYLWGKGSYQSMSSRNGIEILRVQ